MRHVIRYEGEFEGNFAAPRAADGGEYQAGNSTHLRALPWPAEVDGVRFGFMEQLGKRFLAVRLGYGDDEVVLRHPVRLDPTRHLGGRRFSARPIPLSDESAGALFADIIDLNPEQRPELTALRERVRRALRAGVPAGGAVNGEKA